MNKSTTPRAITPYATRGNLRPMLTIDEHPNGYQLTDNGRNYFIRHKDSGVNNGTFTDYDKARRDFAAFEKFACKGHFVRDEVSV